MNAVAISPEVTDEPAGCVRALVRAFALLDKLAMHPAGLTLTESARLAGLPRSTAHRLLTTMESMRYVRFDNTTNQWLVGARTIAFADQFSSGLDLQRLARPAMLSLLASTHVTVSMFVEADRQICCVDQARTSRDRKVMARPGDHLPMHTTASGKLMMAHWDVARIEAHLDSHPLSARTEKSIVEKADFMAELASIRHRGYAVDDEENVEGVRCLAAPVMNKAGEVRAALSVSGPLANLPDGRIEMLSLSLVRTARQLTDDFGGALAA